MNNELAIRPNPQVVTPTQIADHIAKNQDDIRHLRQGTTLDEYVRASFPGKILPKRFEQSSFAKISESLKAFWNSKTVPQRIIGVGGIGGLALNIIMPSEQGFFKRALSMGLDVLAIASVFNPALLLPVAGLYALRGIFTLINGGSFAGLMDIGVALMPGLRSMKLIKEAAKRFNNKGFQTAMNYFLTQGYGPKARVQYKYIKNALSSKAAFKETRRTVLNKVGQGFDTVHKEIRQGMTMATA